MRKSFLGIILTIAVITVGAYAAYDFYRAGYHTRPELPPNAFSISYKNGLRAILVDVSNDEETRRYFGFPMDVPFYLTDAWSFCSPPRDEEAEQVAHFMSQRNLPGERFEAVCRLQVDEDTVIRGLITSVPRL